MRTPTRARVYPRNRLYEKRRRAFSLLEIIIVLVVMVGLLAIVWPNLQKPLRRTSLNSAAQQLREAIDESRYQAIQTGAPVFVQLRQGDNEIRTGGFDSFSNSENGQLGSSNSTFPNSIGASSISPSLSGSQSSFGRTSDGRSSSGHDQTRPIRTWHLPDKIVVSEVNWLHEGRTSSETEEFGMGTTSMSPADNAGDEGIETTQSANASMKYGTSKTDSHRGNSETDLSTELVDSHQDWWLPMIASGQGCDVSIVLLDTSSHETMTVSYESATGSLEIER